MSPFHERMDDMPKQMKWFMTFVNRLGFPIIVCMWLAYQQFVSGKEGVKALQELKDSVMKVDSSIVQLNQTLRRNSRRIDRTDG